MEQKPPRLVQLSKLDGSNGVFDINSCKKWAGLQEIDWFSAVDPIGCQTFLYRTRSGRWVVETCFQERGGIIYGPEDLSPPDSFSETSLEDAAKWFVEKWVCPTSDGESNDQPEMPREIVDHLIRMDIDESANPSLLDKPADPPKPAGTHPLASSESSSGITPSPPQPKSPVPEVEPSRVWVRWRDRPRRPGQFCMKIHDCQRFKISDPGSSEWDEELLVYYLTPDGLWVAHRGHEAGYGDPENPDIEYVEYYQEVDPVYAARDILQASLRDKALPPELEQYREIVSTSEAFGRWMYERRYKGRNQEEGSQTGPTPETDRSEKPSKETRKVLSDGPPEPLAGKSITERWVELTNDLRSRRRAAPTQAALLEYMKDKTTARIDDVAYHVHGDKNAEDAAIRQNVKRTNEAIQGKGLPITLKVGGGFIHKIVDPE